MIPRYSVPEVEVLFSEQSKMSRWLEVELLVVEAMAAEGAVPAADAAACRAAAPVVDAAFVAEVEEREAVTNHDVAAFVDVAQQRMGVPAASWVHYGLTSTDVVDTAQCWALRDAADMVISAQTELLRTLVDTAREHTDTAMIGRTHGIHAEPTTFGAKVALWALQVDRDRARMRTAREAVAVCKLSGAVGTFSNIPPAVEARVAERLGLQPVPATQVVARDRHAEYLWACASAGTTLEMIAVELRHLQRTEVGEVREGFAKGQKGSSAMPHKRNPISAETISGLSRVLRGNLQVGLQDVPLWHERDISHSSAERIVLPDSTHLVLYMTRRMRNLVANLEVDTARMSANLGMLHGVVFSQSVLLALVENGMTRDDAYRVVQACAATSIAEGRAFRDVLAADDRVTLTPDRLDAAFDLARVLQHASRGVRELDGIAL
ncbi:MAG: adenylosuccinate lyase [Ilumatobacteraceae bacterium]